MRVYVFIDGGYVRARLRELKLPLLHPADLASRLVDTPALRALTPNVPFMASRVNYYDAFAEGELRRVDVENYWSAIELLPNVHLGFGELRGLQRKVRQKGVDTLIAVDMVVGAFSGTYQMGILVAGDADFVPVLEEVKRRGVSVVVAGWSVSLAQELQRAADRYIEIQRDWLTPMQVSGGPVPA